MSEVSVPKSFHLAARLLDQNSIEELISTRKPSASFLLPATFQLNRRISLFLIILPSHQLDVKNDELTFTPSPPRIVVFCVLNVPYTEQTPPEERRSLREQ